MTQILNEPSVFVIFGGTGDLARRKLLPALAHLFEREDVQKHCRVLGVSSDTSLDDAAYRELALKALADAQATKAGADALLRALHFQAVERGKGDHFVALEQRLKHICESCGFPRNQAFYLALPPNAVPGVVEQLGAAGLNKSQGWSRLVVEKPFGRDLESAEKLNRLLHAHFRESQIFRIDHYLGKESVQNLLVFRFANAIFEALWNRERVHSVEICVAESLGVGSRAGYYDEAGAMRDMLQNHLAQLLALVAMEVPASFDADAIRYEKLKVLRSVAPIRCQDVVRAQYVAGDVDGKPVAGYLEEPGIAATSQTETFVALELFVNTWRFRGVPFYLRTGKRLKKRVTEIVVRFHDVPVSLFASAGVAMDTADVLVLRLQPEEGFSLHFDVKAPGSPFSLRRIPLSFRYNDAFGRMPEAYETLLLDLLRGDQTLFVHADEAEQSWRIFTPLLEAPPPLTRYAAGSWGPPEAERLGVREVAAWR
jgi:glucose-6-phosphate 1-dehydrogenase